MTGPTQFDPAAYGRHIAASYDETTGRADAGPEVELLSELAHDTAILEFGIGTGRLALPLIERGHQVAGIDGSPDMLAQLRRKPGGQDIQVEIGDFASTFLGTRFGLVVLAMNTVYALPSQQAQVACFANAARHLEAGGRFVVDAWIPDPGAFRDGRAMRLVQHEEGHVVIEVAEIHPATQQMQTNKIFLRSDLVKVFPANHRYAWPAEMDLMAQLAGLTLEHRFADWARRPYRDDSRTHVSIWRKLPDGDPPAG
jgi:SAM-dependent methyltransferase